jgi:anti-sigma regulatory factor (Ser/Thr protein kinase)
MIRALQARRGVLDTVPAPAGPDLGSAARRFTARSCARCSIPLQRTDGPEPGATTISHRFRAEPLAAHTRRALEMLRREIDGTQFHVAALLTTELVANAVEHAGTGSGSEVRFEAALIESRIRVAVWRRRPRLCARRSLARRTARFALGLSPRRPARRSLGRGHGTANARVVRAPEVRPLSNLRCRWHRRRRCLTALTARHHQSVP